LADAVGCTTGPTPRTSAPNTKKFNLNCKDAMSLAFVSVTAFMDSTYRRQRCVQCPAVTLRVSRAEMEVSEYWLCGVGSRLLRGINNGLQASPDSSNSSTTLVPRSTLAGSRVTFGPKSRFFEIPFSRKCINFKF
jgi:hypothetical protein